MKQKLRVFVYFISFCTLALKEKILHIELGS